MGVYGPLFLCRALRGMQRNVELGKPLLVLVPLQIYPPFFSTLLCTLETWFRWTTSLYFLVLWLWIFSGNGRHQQEMGVERREKFRYSFPDSLLNCRFISAFLLLRYPSLCSPISEQILTEAPFCSPLCLGVVSASLGTCLRMLFHPCCFPQAVPTVWKKYTFYSVLFDYSACVLQRTMADTLKQPSIQVQEFVYS